MEGRERRGQGCPFPKKQRENKLPGKVVSKNIGFSLISLLISILISSFLILMIAQLFSLSRNIYLKTENYGIMYNNGRTAIDFLNRHVRVAGNGIINPNFFVDALMNQYINGVCTGSITPPCTPVSIVPGCNTGTHAVQSAMSGWVHLGYFFENLVSPAMNQQVAGNFIPSTCATAVQSLNQNFMGLSLNNQCRYTNTVNFQSAVLEPNRVYTNMGFCLATSCNNETVHNCGGSQIDAVYQRLAQYATVTPLAGANGSDNLTINFQNQSTTNFTTFSGGTLAANAVGTYTFKVSAQNTLQVTDSSTGLTYDVADNVEYMRILLGESDLELTVNNTYTMPGMTRYILANGNVDPYRVLAVKIGIVVRSEDPILQAGQAISPIKVLCCDGSGNWVQYTPPVDRHQRLAFVITVPFPGAKPTHYERHCVTTNSGTYIKMGGVRFATTWFPAEDVCCTAPGSSTCRSFGTWNTCEAARDTTICSKNRTPQ